MDVHDEYVPAETYAEFLERMPQVCVEVVLETERGLLLAKRENEPAKGEWFWPGSRLYKGETTEEAAERVPREELGLEVTIETFLGVYSHFWETSSVTGSPSRHTVNVVYHVRPAEATADVSLDAQHSAVRYVDEIEDGLHEYVETYIRDAELLS